MKAIDVGYIRGELDEVLRIDLARLIETRGLVTGNSGAGKTRSLRMLVERAFGQVQTIIVDPEGEFPTLRERHDFRNQLLAPGDVQVTRIRGEEQVTRAADFKGGQQRLRCDSS